VGFVFAIVELAGRIADLVTTRITVGFEEVSRLKEHWGGSLDYLNPLKTYKIDERRTLRTCKLRLPAPRHYSRHRLTYWQRRIQYP
jgi:hypothetical protein